MDIQRLLTTPLTPEEHASVIDDLQFIARLTETAKSLGYRVVISGGYSVDGALKTITRPHNDIDIGIYGKKPASEAVKEILQSFSPSLLPVLEDKGRKEFWHYFQLKRPDTTWAELYYLQVTTDPFASEKIIMKADGSTTEVQLYDTIHAKFGELSYEIQNPVTELADKIYKRTVRGDEALTKHDQDMSNLVLITNPAKVADAVAEMKQRK